MELYHYGVKGMKWKNHIYSKDYWPDGTPKDRNARAGKYVARRVPTDQEEYTGRKKPTDIPEPESRIRKTPEDSPRSRSSETVNPKKPTWGPRETTGGSYRKKPTDSDSNESTRRKKPTGALPSVRESNRRKNPERRSDNVVNRHRTKKLKDIR